MATHTVAIKCRSVIIGIMGIMRRFHSRPVAYRRRVDSICHSIMDMAAHKCITIMDTTTIMPCLEILMAVVAHVGHLVVLEATRISSLEVEAVACLIVEASELHRSPRTTCLEERAHLVALVPVDRLIWWALRGHLVISSMVATVNCRKAMMRTLMMMTLSQRIIESMKEMMRMTIVKMKSATMNSLELAVAIVINWQYLALLRCHLHQL